MMLDAVGVTYQYGRRRVLHGVDLHAGPGIYGLLGNNGAGKTTLIRILATIFPPGEALVSFDGRKRPAHDREIRRLLGYLPQEYGLPLHLRCLEYLRYVAAMKELPDRAAWGPEDVLDRVGLTEAARTRIGAVSGGMRQRLAIAQALLGKPRLLLFDEPTNGLDPQERVRFRSVLRELAPGATIILSTHIVSDIERDADRLSVMRDGRIAAEGAPDEIIAEARGHVFVVRFRADEWERVSDEWMRRGRDPLLWPGVIANVSAPEGSQVVVRVVSMALPDSSAEAVEPTLEDAFLLLTGVPDGVGVPA